MFPGLQDESDYISMSSESYAYAWAFRGKIVATLFIKLEKQNRKIGSIQKYRMFGRNIEYLKERLQLIYTACLFF